MWAVTAGELEHPGEADTARVCSWDDPRRRRMIGDRTPPNMPDRLRFGRLVDMLGRHADTLPWPAVSSGPSQCTPATDRTFNVPAEPRADHRRPGLLMTIAMVEALRRTRAHAAPLRRLGQALEPIRVRDFAGYFPIVHEIVSSPEGTQFCVRAGDRRRRWCVTRSG